MVFYPKCKVGDKLGTENFQCPYQESKLQSTAKLVARANNEISNNNLKKSNLVWLELNGCAGNIISLLNGQNPDFQYLLTQMANLVYSNSLLAAEGSEAMDELFGAIGSDYILAVEGAVSLKDEGIYNVIGRHDGQLITGLDAVRQLGENAAYVIAVGACASHGGVSAARPNPSGCVGVHEVLQRKVIQLTGCPCHPDWFMGTLAYIMLYGEPPLDSRNRPLMFYSTTIHDRCPRRSYFDQGIFASKLGEKTCMFRMGCRGPVTQIDCPIRQWNGHVNWPVEDDSPCIGCAQFGFPDAMEPFITFKSTRRE
ncbi:hydrogenase small subunit [[Clostridium] propionicum DSM 1682]|uniref:Hydrogenase small subunit n=1 Tax=Anaerotignum propionicum DSM 1682 TaxID=991789 RepID=A0A0X8VCE3_ANAPI|nr:periplasmic [NiFe] hydrogenase small subunit precursor [Anaerotignum propionicum DSM 1682]SHE40840.1 hydrogenase small subunit [[Clostridium] propionicum DSM 1682] [Anaerotignum propionicum DSM 1682]